MEDQNPYRAPEAAIADLSTDAGLAGRGERLGAAIIDTLIMLVVLLPIMFLGGYFQAAMNAGVTGVEIPWTTELLWAGIGLLVFFAVQGYPLYATAQTWGKRLLKLRIVGLDGTRLPFGRLIGLRYLPMQAVGAVPFVGPLLSIVNVLFIFRENRRCVHDLIAGTKVIKVR